MGKGILNRGTQVHLSKTKKFKWGDELDDDAEQFKFIKQFKKGHTLNEDDENKIYQLSHMKRLRELEK